MAEITHSRRDFLKASGMAMLGAAAAAGAFGVQAAHGQERVAPGTGEGQPAKGVTNFSETESMYADVFPEKVRYIPVIDASPICAARAA